MIKPAEKSKPIFKTRRTLVKISSINISSFFSSGKNSVFALLFACVLAIEWWYHTYNESSDILYARDFDTKKSRLFIRN